MGGCVEFDGNVCAHTKHTAQTKAKYGKMRNIRIKGEENAERSSINIEVWAIDSPIKPPKTSALNNHKEKQQPENQLRQQQQL